MMSRDFHFLPWVSATTGVFVSILLVANPASAQVASCSSAAAKGKRISLNLTFDYRGTDYSLRGVDFDRSRLPSINSKLLGVPENRQFNVSDKELFLERFEDPASRLKAQRFTEAYDQWKECEKHRPFKAASEVASAPPQEASRCGPENDRRKALQAALPPASLSSKGALTKILRRFKDRAAKDGLEVILNYSGHGETCDEDWCMILPWTYGDGPGGSNPSGASSPSLLLSCAEIDAALEPAGVIADSCHSGNCFSRLKRTPATSAMNQDGFFLYASALGFQEAEDGAKNKGGALISLLGRLAEADPNTLCNLDLDSDGALSQREVAFLVMMNFMPQESKLEFVKMRGAKLTPDLRYSESAETQLATSAAGDGCFVSLGKSCPNRPFPDDFCLAKKTGFSRSLESMGRLASNPELAVLKDTAATTGARGLAVQAPSAQSAQQPPAPSRGVTNGTVRTPEKMIDERRKSAVQFLRDWQADYQGIRNSCSEIWRQTPFAACSAEWSEDLQRFLKFTRDVESIVSRLASLKEARLIGR